MGLAWGVQKTGVFRTFLGGIGSWLVSSGFYDREPLPVQSRPHELLQVPTAMLQHFQHQVGGWKGRGYLLLSKGWTSTHLCHSKKAFGMGSFDVRFCPILIQGIGPCSGYDVGGSGQNCWCLSIGECSLYLRFLVRDFKGKFCAHNEIFRNCVYIKRGLLWNLYFWRLTFRIISEINLQDLERQFEVDNYCLAVVALSSHAQYQNELTRESKCCVDSKALGLLDTVTSSWSDLIRGFKVHMTQVCERAEDKLAQENA